MSSKHEKLEKHECAFCHVRGQTALLGPFKRVAKASDDTRVHASCANFSPLICHRDLKSAAESELKRSSVLKCAHCGKGGANVGCAVPDCHKSAYHLPCAAASGCVLDVFRHLAREGGFFCSKHASHEAASKAVAALNRNPAAWIHAVDEAKAGLQSGEALLDAVFNQNLDAQGMGLGKDKEVAQQVELAGVQPEAVVDRQDRIIEKAFNRAEAQGHRCDVCSTAFRFQALGLPRTPQTWYINPRSKDALHLASKVLPECAARLITSIVPALACEAGLPGTPSDHRHQDDFDDDNEVVDLGEGSVKLNSPYGERTWDETQQVQHNGISWMGPAALRCGDCGVRVHAGCYGVPTNVCIKFLRSTDKDEDQIWRCNWCAAEATRLKNGLGTSGRPTDSDALPVPGHVTLPSSCVLCPIGVGVGTQKHALKKCIVVIDPALGDVSMLNVDSSIPVTPSNVQARAWVHGSCALWSGCVRTTDGATVRVTVGDMNKFDGLTVRIHGGGAAMAAAAAAISSSVENAGGASSPESACVDVAALLRPAMISARVCTLCKSREGVVHAPCTDSFHRAVESAGSSSLSTSHPSAHAPCAVNALWTVEQWAPNRNPSKWALTKSSSSHVASMGTTSLAAPSLGLISSGGLALFDPSHQPTHFYCMCREPFDSTSPMTECEICQGWYHNTCMGINEDTLGENETFCCPSCVALSRQGKTVDAAVIEMNKRFGKLEYDITPPPPYTRLLVPPALLPVCEDDSVKSPREELDDDEVDEGAGAETSHKDSRKGLECPPDRSVAGSDNGADVNAWLTPALLYSTRAWADMADRALKVLRHQVLAAAVVGDAFGGSTEARGGQQPVHLLDLARLLQLHNTLYVPFALADRARAHLLETTSSRTCLTTAMEASSVAFIALQLSRPAATECKVLLSEAAALHTANIEVCKLSVVEIFSKLPSSKLASGEQVALPSGAALEAILFTHSCLAAVTMHALDALEEHAMAVSNEHFNALSGIGAGLEDVASDAAVADLCQTVVVALTSAPALLPAGLLSRAKGVKALLPWALRIAATMRPQGSHSNIHRISGPTLNASMEEDQMGEEEVYGVGRAGETSSREASASVSVSALSQVLDASEAVDVDSLATLVSESVQDPLRLALADIFLKYPLTEQSKALEHMHVDVETSSKQDILGRGKRARAPKQVFGSSAMTKQVGFHALSDLRISPGEAPIGWSLFYVKETRRRAVAELTIGMSASTNSAVPSAPAELARHHPFAAFAGASVLAASGMGFLNRLRLALPRSVMQTIMTNFGGHLPGSRLTGIGAPGLSTRRSVLLQAAPTKADPRRLMILVKEAAMLRINGVEVVKAAELADLANDWMDRAAKVLNSAESAAQAATVLSPVHRPSMQVYLETMERLVADAEMIPVSFGSRITDVEDARDALSWRNRADAALASISSATARNGDDRAGRPTLSSVEQLVKLGYQKAGIDADDPVRLQLVNAMKLTQVGLASLGHNQVEDGSVRRSESVRTFDSTELSQTGMEAAAFYLNATGGTGARNDWIMQTGPDPRAALQSAIDTLRASASLRISALQKRISTLNVLPLQCREEEDAVNELKALDWALRLLDMLQQMVVEHVQNACDVSISQLRAISGLNGLHSSPAGALMNALIDSRQCRDVTLAALPGSTGVSSASDHSQNQQGSQDSSADDHEGDDLAGMEIDEEDLEIAQEIQQSNGMKAGYTLVRGMQSEKGGQVNHSKLLVACRTHGCSALAVAAAALAARVARISSNLQSTAEELQMKAEVTSAKNEVALADLQPAAVCGDLHSTEQFLSRFGLVEAAADDAVALPVSHGAKYAEVLRMKRAVERHAYFASPAVDWLRNSVTAVQDLERVVSSEEDAQTQGVLCVQALITLACCSVWPLEFAQACAGALLTFHKAQQLKTCCDTIFMVLQDPPSMDSKGDHPSLVQLSSLVNQGGTDSSLSFAGAVHKLHADAWARAHALICCARVLSLHRTAVPPVPGALLDSSLPFALTSDAVSLLPGFFEAMRMLTPSSSDAGFSITEYAARAVHDAALNTINRAYPTASNTTEAQFVFGVVEALGSRLAECAAFDEAAGQWLSTTASVASPTGLPAATAEGQALLKSMADVPLLPQVSGAVVAATFALGLAAAAGQLASRLSGQSSSPPFLRPALDMSGLAAVSDACSALLSGTGVPLGTPLPPVLMTSSNALAVALASARQWKSRAQALLQCSPTVNEDVVASAEALISMPVVAAVTFAETSLLRSGIVAAKTWATSVAAGADEAEAAVREAAASTTRALGASSGLLSMDAGAYYSSLDGRLRAAAERMAMLCMQAGRHVFSDSSRSTQSVSAYLELTSSITDSVWWRAAEEKGKILGVLQVRPSAASLRLAVKALIRLDVVISARYLLGLDAPEPLTPLLGTEHLDEKSSAPGTESGRFEASSHALEGEEIAANAPPTVNVRYTLRPRPNLLQMTALMSRAQSSGVGLVPAAEAVAGGDAFLPLLGLLATTAKKSAGWASKAMQGLLAIDEPAAPLLASLLTNNAECVACAEEEVAMVEAAAVYAEHKTFGDGPWAYRGVTGLDRAADEYPFIPPGWSHSHPDPAVTAAAAAQRRKVKWAKYKGFPFWPAESVDPSVASGAFAAQATQQASQGRVLVRLLGSHPGFQSGQQQLAWVKRLLVRPWGKGAGTADDPNLHPLLQECPRYAEAVKVADKLIVDAAGEVAGVVGVDSWENKVVPVNLQGQVLIPLPEKTASAGPAAPAAKAASVSEGAGFSKTSSISTPPSSAPNLEGLSAAERLRALLAWKQQAAASQASTRAASQASAGGKPQADGPKQGLDQHCAGRQVANVEDGNDDEEEDAIGSGKSPISKRPVPDLPKGPVSAATLAASLAAKSAEMAAEAKASAATARAAAYAAAAASAVASSAAVATQPHPSPAPAPASVAAPAPASKDDEVIRSKTRDMIATNLGIGLPQVCAPTASRAIKAADGSGTFVRNLLSVTATRIEGALYARYPLSTQRSNFSTALKTLVFMLKSITGSASGIRQRILTGWLRPYALVRASAADLEKEGVSIATALGTSAIKDAKVTPGGAAELLGLGAGAGIKRPVPAPQPMGSSEKKQKPFPELEPLAPLPAAFISPLGLGSFALKKKQEQKPDDSSGEESDGFDEFSGNDMTAPFAPVPAPVAAVSSTKDVGAFLKSLAGLVPKLAPAPVTAAAPAEVNPFAGIMAASAGGMHDSDGSEEVDEDDLFSAPQGEEEGARGKRKRERSMVSPAKRLRTDQRSESGPGGDAGTGVSVDGTSLRLTGPAHPLYIDGGKGKDYPAVLHIVAVRCLQPLDAASVMPRISPPVRGPLLPPDLKVDGSYRIAKFTTHLDGVYNNSSTRSLAVFACVPDNAADSSASASCKEMWANLCKEGRVAVLKATGPTMVGTQGLSECFVYLLPPIADLEEAGRKEEAAQLTKAVRAAADAAAGLEAPSGSVFPPVLQILAGTYGLGSVPPGLPGTTPGSSVPRLPAAVGVGRDWMQLAYAVLEYRPKEYALLQEPGVGRTFSYAGEDFAGPSDRTSKGEGEGVTMSLLAAAVAGGGGGVGGPNATQMDVQSGYSVLGADFVPGPGGLPVPRDLESYQLMAGTAKAAAQGGYASVSTLQVQLQGDSTFDFLRPDHRFYPAFLQFVREAAGSNLEALANVSMPMQSPGAAFVPPGRVHPSVPIGVQAGPGMHGMPSFEHMQHAGQSRVGSMPSYGQPSGQGNGPNIGQGNGPSMGIHQMVGGRGMGNGGRGMPMSMGGMPQMDRGRGRGMPGVIQGNVMPAHGQGQGMPQRQGQGQATQGQGHAAGAGMAGGAAHPQMHQPQSFPQYQQQARPMGAGVVRGHGGPSASAPPGRGAHLTLPAWMTQQQ